MFWTDGSIVPVTALSLLLITIIINLMHHYIKPEINVIEIDTRATLMATSPITWGEGSTNTMEAPDMRRSSGWTEYEGR